MVWYTALHKKRLEMVGPEYNLRHQVKQLPEQHKVAIP